MDEMDEMDERMERLKEEWKDGGLRKGVVRSGLIGDTKKERPRRAFLLFRELSVQKR